MAADTVTLGFRVPRETQDKAEAIVKIMKERIAPANISRTRVYNLALHEGLELMLKREREAGGAP